MDFTQLYQTLIDSAVLIILAMVGIGLAWVKVQASKFFTGEDLKASVLLTLTTLENSVKGSVQALGVDAKKAVADGVITKEELADIQSKAWKRFNDTTTKEVQERLQAHVGDLNTFVMDKVAAELQKVEKVTG